jgi:hypothetical protein
MYGWKHGKVYQKSIPLDLKIELCEMNIKK